MSIKLSKRLLEVVKFCDPCDTIIDVGTDHGKVPITIANMGICKNVIAIDNKKGPLKTCEENAEKYLINNEVQFKTILCEGITKVDKNNECGIIITGVGFDNMKEILKDINDYNFKYLILSPHTKINELIKLLSIKNINIVNEKAVLDNDKYYHILKAVKNENK